MHFRLRDLISNYLVILCVLILCRNAGAERLPIKIYTSADGLGSSASFNLVSDRRGFIWLCSRDGLVRFDGYRFINYRIGDENADPAVFNLLPTSSGEYWIDLNRGTDYRFIPRPENQPLESLPIKAGSGDVRIPIETIPTGDAPIIRFEDLDKNLWAGDGKGIYLVTQSDGRFQTQLFPLYLPGMPKPAVTFITFENARDGSGLWLGTDWGVVRRFPDGRMIHFSIHPQNGEDPVRLMAEDGGGHLWIAKDEGVFVLNVSGAADSNTDITAAISDGDVFEDGSASLPQLPGAAYLFDYESLFRDRSPQTVQARKTVRTEVHDVLSGKNGHVWVATNKGVIHFDGVRFHHYTTDDGLASNLVGKLTEGMDGSIWMAGDGGLHRLNPKGLTTFDETDGLERARINNIFEDRQGRLIVSSGNFGTSVYANGRFEMIHPSLPADEQVTWQSNATMQDSRGDWWVNTNKNLHRFTGNKKLEELDGRAPDQRLNNTNGLIGGNSLKVFETSNGDVWISSYLSADVRGMSRLRSDGKILNYFPKDRLPNPAIATAMAETVSGEAWFGFVEGGIARFRNEGFEELKDEGVPTSGIPGMFRDNKGRLWIATSREGLFRVDDPGAASPTFKRYSIDDGLASNNVRCVTEDLMGNIYVGTVRGVNRLNPETGAIRYYGTADGLASDFINVAYRDRHGAIWLGTLNGLSKLLPRPDESTGPPQIFISGVRVAGAEQSVAPIGQTSATLTDQPSGVGNIQIDYLSTQPGSAGGIRYQHRFEGASEWGAPTADTSVNFANLSAGNYRFEVRAVDLNGKFSLSPAIVNFTILRPIWQQWWFLLFVATVIATVLYLFYRYRLNQLLELERVRTRIASDLHDDLGASLSQIAILSEVAKQKSGGNGAAEPLAVIADTSRTMIDSMSDIVWAINPKKDTLGDLVQRMRRFAEDSLDSQGIDYEFNFDPKDSAVELGADARRESYLIFKEAINNLMKHSGAKTVKIDVERRSHTLKILIEDNGVGFDTDINSSFAYGGNGLQNMHRRAQLMNGELELRSERGSGTVVEMRIPI